MWLPEDRAKMLAFLAWRREFCPSCKQHRSDWFDKHGKVLKDPPFELAFTVCPPCADLADSQESNPPKGTHPYFKPLPDDEEEG